MGANDPRVVANSDPKDMIGRIYVGYHLTLFHTKFTGFRPCGFKEEDFYVIHIICLWQIMMPPGMANLDPRDMVGRINKEYYLRNNFTLL